MMKSIVMSMTLCSCIHAYAQGVDDCHAARPSEIAVIFKQGIVQNENFRQAVAASSGEAQQGLRKKLEHYDEEILMPCVRRAARLMAAHTDPALMRRLMELCISYANSADETISYALGRLFAADPGTVERAVEAFPSNERMLLAQSIQAGWANVKPDMSPARRNILDGRLEKLLTSSAAATGDMP